MRLDEAQTPCRVLDLGALERNVEKLGGFLRTRGVRHRAHCRSRREWGNTLFVLTSVVSRAKPEKAVCDAALKVLSFDAGPPVVHGRTDVRYVRWADEHGLLEDPDARVDGADQGFELARPGRTACERRLALSPAGRSASSLCGVSGWRDAG
jgi:D-serine deaminase-like pyridoxal phosphate-dependent protein